MLDHFNKKLLEELTPVSLLKLFLGNKRKRGRTFKNATITPKT